MSIVKTVSGNSNNGLKFSDTMSGPSGNYGRTISARSGSKGNYDGIISGTTNTEEINFEKFLSGSNMPSASNMSSASNASSGSNGTNIADIIIPKFKEEYKKQLANVETELKTQIEDAKLSIKENEEERKKLMEKWA